VSRSEAARSGPRSWLAESWLPLLVVVIGYVGVTFATLRPYDFNPTGPIRIGTMLPAERFWTPTTRVEPGTGYDGQWYFYIAHDPLLRAPDPERFIDLPAYRYGRILYPALAWALALGQPAAQPWSMLAVNFLAVLVGAVACVDNLRQLRANRWLALAYAFSPPMLIGTAAMLTEPTSMALVTVGVALALRGRHWPAGCALALAVLAREPSALVALAFGLYALARLDWRRGAAYLAPLVVPILWHLSIWARMGIMPSAQNQDNLTVPFGGPYYRLGLILGWHGPMLGETAPFANNVFGEAAIIITSAAIIVIGLTKVIQRRDVFAWMLLLQAVLAAVTSEAIWADLFSYGRALGLLYFTFGLMLLTNPRRSHLLPARLHEWTMPVPDTTIFGRRLSFPVPSSAPPSFSTMKRSAKQS
jgi:hypothetical protein